MTLDELMGHDLRNWIESDELHGNSPVIADVDGLRLPIERIEVSRGRLVIFVDMYNGLQNREKGEEE